MCSCLAVSAICFHWAWKPTGDLHPTRSLDSALKSIHIFSSLSLTYASFLRQPLDLERIHEELFALREAKLALDKTVTLAPELRVGELGETKRFARNGRSLATMRRAATDSGERYRVPWPTATGGIGRSTGKTFHSAAGETTRATGGDRSGRLKGDRRALVELQLDPDLPLPLPRFPGYGKASAPANRGRQDRPQSVGKAAGARPGAGGGGDHHGYFVPGVVAPRQRQSHGLPQELRAISTVPTPETLPLAAAGGRRRVRPRPSSTSAVRGKRVTPPPRPSPEVGSQPRGGKSERVGVSSLPEPGSAAALAAARQQRRLTSQAVDDLRREMREREGRLERELSRLKRIRPEGATVSEVAGVGATAAAVRPASARATPALSNMPRVADRRRLTASRGRRSKARSGRLAEWTRPKHALGGKPPSKEVGTQIEAAGAGVVVRPIQTADAQAQAATDGVTLFLHQQPAFPPALRDQEEHRRSEVEIPILAGRSGHQDGHSQTMGIVGGQGGNESASFASSVSGEDGLGPLGTRRVSPPPPVVFLEGEGRNIYWRPSDDDRLLKAGGGVTPGVPLGGGGGSGSGVVRLSASRSSGDVLREMLEGGDAKPISVVQGDAGEEGDAGGKTSSAIRVTAGGIETADEGQRRGDRWADLAGMLALSATVAIETEAPQADEERDKGEKVGETLAGALAPTAAPPPTASPELLDLMREVVGQQKGLGEERAALMQVR